jgi:hypothetical protein
MAAGLLLSYMSEKAFHVTPDTIVDLAHVDALTELSFPEVRIMCFRNIGKAKDLKPIMLTALEPSHVVMVSLRYFFCLLIVSLRYSQQHSLLATGATSARARAPHCERRHCRSGCRPRHTHLHRVVLEAAVVLPRCEVRKLGGIRAGVPCRGRGCVCIR